MRQHQKREKPTNYRTSAPFCPDLGMVVKDTVCTELRLDHHTQLCSSSVPFGGGDDNEKYIGLCQLTVAKRFNSFEQQYYTTRKPFWQQKDPPTHSLTL